MDILINLKDRTLTIPRYCADPTVIALYEIAWYIKSDLLSATLNPKQYDIDIGNIILASAEEIEDIEYMKLPER